MRETRDKGLSSKRPTQRRRSMDINSVLAKIEQAAQYNVRTLDLSDSALMFLPPQITTLTSLRSLKLTRNQISILPSNFSDLTNLESLDLSFNQLSSFPNELGKLKSLLELDLSFNQLTSLPKGITGLISLRSLHLAGNHLSSLPDEMSELNNLNSLVLTGNQLTMLPEVICRLKNLTNLSLSDNKLGKIPKEIIRLENLTYLYLSGNELTAIEPWISELSNLRVLELRENRLPLSPEVLAAVTEVRAIFAAIGAIATGQRLNEAKMLVLGDGDVGKSSIVERLVSNTYDPYKRTTLGVDINDEMKVLQSKVRGAGDSIRLNIWDFGGQEIQHSTHQFFLTTRSLYLLVVDARKGDQISNIEYWLKLIVSFGGDSPIIIVVNQIDQLEGQRPLNLDRKGLQKKYNIRHIVETSCKTGVGIDKLRVAITREVEQMKHVHDLWPREWLAIKKRLTEVNADYIPIERYFEICREERLSDTGLQQSLLDILHVLGTVVRLAGDTQVLKPRWVTQGVYGLLTSSHVVKNQGQFDLSDVGAILSALPNSADHYPRHTHRRLIEVMKHFELCFEFTDRPGHYLIPRQLHDDEWDIPWNDTDALRFEYHYETLPDAVISRFIVRMNQYITKQYYWKNGVFLNNDQNRAKIKADLVDRRIFISIIGHAQTRRAFLAIIRSAFAEINSRFKIEIKQMIPVPGFPSELVSYDDLLIHEEMNEQEILVPGLRTKMSVRDLLEGIETPSFRQDYYRGGPQLQKKAQPVSKREFESTPQIPKSTTSPVKSLVAFVLGFAIVLASIVGAAAIVTKWVSATAGLMTGIIVIGALLAVGIIGALTLRNDDRLSEESFLRLMIESYSRLTLLRRADLKQHDHGEE